MKPGPASSPASPLLTLLPSMGGGQAWAGEEVTRALCGNGLRRVAAG